MQSKFLKSTTAMVLAIAVAAPSPILAQDSDATTSEQLKKKLEQAAEKAEGVVGEVTDKLVPTETEAEAQAEATTSEPAAEATTAAEAEADAATEPKPETAEAEALPEADADGSLKAEGGTDAEVQAGDADATATAEGATEVKPAEDVAEEPDATAEEPKVAEDAATTTEAPAASAETEATETEAAPTVAEETTEPSSDAATTETASEAPEPDATETVAEEAKPADEAPADQATVAEEQPAQTEEPKVAEGETKAEGDAQVEAKAEPSQQTLSGEATEVQASSAGSEEGELVEEKVTEDTSRSSSEEFDTKVDGQADVTAAAEAGDDDDDGLSTAQKIAIAGLGALAVGALLNNGQRVVSNSGDRVVVDDNGTYRVLKNDDSLLRQPGADVKTYSFSDGSTRTVVTNPDGSQVETIRASDGRVLSRTRVLADGREVVLFDDTRAFKEVAVNELPQVRESRSIDFQQTDEQALREALQARLQNDPGRSFSLAQVRNIQQVRALAPEIEVNTVNFDTGSAVIRPEEAEALAALGAAMKDAIEQNPGEVFLVEGHTDAVGGAGYNLALSDRRAESLALALTEYFAVPPENMIVQGYGESDLKVQTADAERANRRAAVRRITPLLGENS